jgi:hypothetical protein
MLNVGHPESHNVRWLPEAIREDYPGLFDKHGDMRLEVREQLLDELMKYRSQVGSEEGT